MRNFSKIVAAALVITSASGAFACGVILPNGAMEKCFPIPTDTIKRISKAEKYAVIDRIFRPGGGAANWYRKCLEVTTKIMRTTEYYQMEESLERLVGLATRVPAFWPEVAHQAGVFLIDSEEGSSAQHCDWSR